MEEKIKKKLKPIIFLGLMIVILVVGYFIWRSQAFEHKYQACVDECEAIHSDELSKFELWEFCDLHCKKKLSE